MALPLFLLQRAPFKLLRDRMATLYDLLEAQTQNEIAEKLEEHRAVLKARTFRYISI